MTTTKKEILENFKLELLAKKEKFFIQDTSRGADTYISTTDALGIIEEYAKFCHDQTRGESIEEWSVIIAKKNEELHEFKNIRDGLRNLYHESLRQNDLLQELIESRDNEIQELKENVIGFGEWIGENCESQYTTEPYWVITGDRDGNRFTTKQIYDKYKEKQIK